MASLKYMSRKELDAEARNLGIDPSDLDTREDVIEAIEAAQSAGKETPTVADENTTSSSNDDAGQAEVQARMDEEQKKGYVGQTSDPTPDTAYSLEGGAPEPGDNPTTPSEEDVKNDPTLGDQYLGQATYTDRS
jgi:hypothetical protein